MSQMEKGKRKPTSKFRVFSDFWTLRKKELFLCSFAKRQESKIDVFLFNVSLAYLP